MLFIRLLRNIRNLRPGAHSLYPLHFGSKVGFERAMVNLTKSLSTESSDGRSEDKVWNQSLSSSVSRHTCKERHVHTLSRSRYPTSRMLSVSVGMIAAWRVKGRGEWGEGWWSQSGNKAVGHRCRAVRLMDSRRCQAVRRVLVAVGRVARTQGHVQLHGGISYARMLGCRRESGLEPAFSCVLLV